MRNQFTISAKLKIIPYQVSFNKTSKLAVI